MNNSNVIKDGREEMGILYHRYLHYSLRNILFESEFELVVNVYCKLYGKYGSAILHNLIHNSFNLLK